MATKDVQARREYGLAVARVTLQGLVDLCAIRAGISGAPPSRRRLINFLRGNQLPAAGVKPERLARSTFGIFWSHGSSWLDDLLASLAEEGYLEMTGEAAGGVALTAAGKRLLAGRERPRATLLPQSVRLGVHPEVEERLRDLRRRLAEKAGRPVYGVFSNTTLAHLATSRPRNVAELAQVPGLGAERVRRFGARILAVLRRR